MASPDKDKLKRQLERLQAKRSNLEIALRELGEDAPEESTDWFEVELRKVEAQVAEVTGQLEEIQAQEKDAEVAKNMEERNQFARRYEEVRDAGQIHTLPAPLVRKYAEAYAAEGMDRLLNRD